eukprot:XP_001185026.2 PREDICTED: toll-like receptor 13 [Strongylocentrotus purpuratus]
MSSQLSILDLTASNLKSLPNDILKWSLNLDTARLFYNQLSFINVSSCGKADIVLMTGNRLQHLTAENFTFECHTDTLNIRENPIQSVDPDVIASLRVRYLVLGGYPLSDEVLANIILGISKSDIEVLTILEGSVGAFPTGFFDPLRDSSLSVLDLVFNELNSLHPLVFSNLTKLREFTITDNKLPIDEIQPDFFEGMNALKVLTITDNQWLIDWLNGPIRLKKRDKTICSSASLEPLRKKPLMDFDPNELCKINNSLYSLIPLISISLVVISVLLYHYRWQLRYKLFLLRLAACGYKEMRDARDHNDYEFDVNIIFYDDDEEWIREQLRPALEERLPQFQRNVVGDEDLVLGMHYLDSVDYVVSHSYKTVILLSRAAVHDHWFILKFRTAMDHVSDTLTEFVVVVFLEDIPDDEMPFLARLYLSDGRPYIHWTEDVREQDYFWEELTKNLTINLRTNDLIPNE